MPLCWPPSKRGRRGPRSCSKRSHGKCDRREGERAHSRGKRRSARRAHRRAHRQRPRFGGQSGRERRQAPGPRSRRARAFRSGCSDAADRCATEWTLPRPAEAGTAPTLVAFVQDVSSGEVLQALALPCPPVARSAVSPRHAGSVHDLLQLARLVAARHRVERDRLDLGRHSGAAELLVALPCRSALRRLARGLQVIARVELARVLVRGTCASRRSSPGGCRCRC